MKRLNTGESSPNFKESGSSQYCLTYLIPMAINQWTIVNFLTADAYEDDAESQEHKEEHYALDVVL